MGVKAPATAKRSEMQIYSTNRQRMLKANANGAKQMNLDQNDVS